MTDDPWENESEWDTGPVLPASRPSLVPPSAPVATPPPVSPPVSPAPVVEAPPKGRRRRRRSEEEFDDDVEDFPAPPRRGRAFLVFLAFSAILAGGALFGLRWVQRQIDPPGVPGATVQITIAQNTSAARVGKILHARGIIGDPRVFRYYVQWKGRGGFEAGRYQFRKNESFDSVIEALVRGPSIPDQTKVTFPEGFRLAQFADRVGAKLDGRTAARFQQVASSGRVRSALLPADSVNLEGFLFPSTYQFALDDDEETILARTVEAFDVAAEAEGLGEAKAKVGRTPYEALIVASLIEREAKTDEDRGKVARVIYNRLEKDTALQIDATLIYGMGGNVDRVLFEDLQKDGPYNTYTRKGLPPTPIASPGRESIRAALNPTPGDWLYYVVVTKDGQHAFATTFKEHKKNIKLAEQNGVR